MDEEIISVNLYHSFYQFICLLYLFIIFLFVNDAEELEVQLSLDFSCLQALYSKESFSVDYGTSLSEFSTNLQNVLRSRPTKLHFCQQTRRVPIFYVPTRTDSFTLRKDGPSVWCQGITSWSLLLILSTNWGVTAYV